MTGSSFRVLVELGINQPFDPARVAQEARTLHTAGFVIDAEFAPLAVGSNPTQGAPHGRALVRGWVGADHLSVLQEQASIVWRDDPLVQLPLGRPRVAGPCPIPPCDCTAGSCAEGNFAEVATYLGVDRLWAAGYRGAGIVVGIVDCGLCAHGRPVHRGETAVVPNVGAGFPTADWGTTSRVARRWRDHGNMTATDVLAMAPEAKLYDIRIADRFAGDEAILLSNACAAIDWAIKRHRLDGTPHVLCNCWGLHKPLDQPAYANDPTHPLTRKIVEAMDEGMLVLFSAGNCGLACPARYCQDTGNGFRIWAANGHPRVMTVGAITLREQLAGYSSPGPASLDPGKPDFCSITQFAGYYPDIDPFRDPPLKCDPGTSAATAIAAGVVALLKQGHPSLTQDQAKAVLKSTAKPIGPGPFNRFAGAGVIQAGAAWDALAKS
jgi:subtilisin family serine protease